MDIIIIIIIIIIVVTSLNAIIAPKTLVTAS